jgi:hypothetical protein
MADTWYQLLDATLSHLPIDISSSVQKLGKWRRLESKQQEMEVVEEEGEPSVGFVEGSQVLMADGSTLPIEAVKAGDEVFSYNGM